MDFYILDANAVLAVIAEELGYEVVCDAYEKASKGKARLI
jgi:PIN domain nuclease of toxin-antitoxin system